MLDYFFTLENVQDIRMKTKIIHTFPDLIKASGAAIKIYTPTIVEIATNLLVNPPQKPNLINFLEVRAAGEVFVGLYKILILIAQIDPEAVSQKAEQIIPALCSYLSVSEERHTILASLNLLFTLLSPPASTMIIRGKVPIILAVCSKFLNQTKSRKARMTTMKVIDAIGVFEVH